MTEVSAPGKAGRNLPAAIAVGLTLGALIIGTLYVSPLAFLGLAGGSVLLAQAEFYGAIRRAGFEVSRGIGLVVGALILLGAYHRGLPGIAFGLAVALPATALWIAADPHRTHQAARGLGMTVFGVAWIPFLGSHVILLSLLPDGADLTILVIGLIAFYDVGAFAFGVLFGRTPIAPTVSPKKSVQGAIGGTLLITALAVLVGPYLVDLSRASLLLMAGVTAIVAPIGDLSESLVKRDLGIKDMGSFLPGHGGMLDRIDSLLLAIPVSYWVIRGTFG